MNIEVRGLRVLGTHGLLPEEQSRPQPFEVDLDVTVARAVEADLRGEAQPGPTDPSDRIESTLDYGAVVAQAADVVRHGSFRLLETLAEQISARVLAMDDRVRSVAVRVRKLRPPLPEDIGSVGVRVERHR